MKRLLSFRLILAALLVLLAAPAHAEKRVALVIGNNDYKNVPKLQKAVNDARTTGEVLKRLGFSVMVAENQDRAQFSLSLGHSRIMRASRARNAARIIRSRSDTCSSKEPRDLRRGSFNSRCLREVQYLAATGPPKLNL